MGRPRLRSNGTMATWRAAPWAVLVVLLVAVLILALWQSVDRINHDCALYLQQAELMLDGGVPYVDFVDTNPPLIVYLSVPPVLLSRALGVSPGMALHGLVGLLLIVSTVEILVLLRQRPGRVAATGQWLILVMWLALFLRVWGRCELGQREHLFVLLYVPYLFLRAARYRGAKKGTGTFCRNGPKGAAHKMYLSPFSFAVLLGVQAGVGAAIKPHFLVVVLLVELALWSTARRRRVLRKPENVALLLVVAVYLAHWLLVPAAMREAFFGRWLPMIRDGYGAYNVGYGPIAERILHTPLWVVLLLATVLTAAVALRYRFRSRGCLLGLAVFAAASLAMVFVQQKGWSYHFIPFETAAGLALAVLCVAAPRALGTAKKVAGTLRVPSAGCGTRSVPATLEMPGWKWLAGGCLTVVLAAIFVAALQGGRRREPQEFAALRQIIADRSKPADRVLFIATSVRPAYPMLLQLGRKPGSRYLCSFPIAFFYHDRDARPPNEPPYRRPSEAPAAEQQFLAELSADVGRLQPRLIVIPDFPGGMGLPKEFNHFDYLTQSGWAEQGLRSYREIPGPRGWRVFERG